jgi:hypothetical protein
MDWDTAFFTIDSDDHYEIVMSDKWTSSGHQSGLAGSGSTGVWGVGVTNWTTPGTTAHNANLPATDTLTYTKVENIFDTEGTRGGSANAGQRDLCVKCHSYYSYGSAAPATPSGKPNAATIVPATSTDSLAEFNPNNLAHHAVYDRGRNQPIKANYGNTSTTYNSAYNPSWPKYSTTATGDTVTVTSGAAVFAGNAALPSVTQPGWYIYINADTPPAAATTGTLTGTASSGFLEITSITDNKHFTVRAKNTSGGWVTNPSVTGTPDWFVSAGLGNAFIPPFGPWSILRCTDCHGSTKTDPVGPHASVNRWLVKSPDTNVSFRWLSSTGIVTVTPGTPGQSGNFCFNCHRRDVYGDTNLELTTSTPLNAYQSRIPHSRIMDNDGNTSSAAGSVWPQFCRMCHGGDRLGGIHGTSLRNNVTPSGRLTNLQGKRFLNGSSWGSWIPSGTAAPANGGLKRSTTSELGGCYVANKANLAIDSCGHAHANEPYDSTATYDYDNPGTPTSQ